MIDNTIDITQLYIVREIQYALSQSIQNRNGQARIFLENYRYQNKLLNYISAHIKHRYISLEFTAIPKEASEILPQCPITEQTQIRQLLQIGMSIIALDLLKKKQ